MSESLPKHHDLLVLLGPTASGKTRVAVELAEALGGEIISADSRQVFRGMDIGTGKDLEDYGEIPYHLIDILPAGAEFCLFQFQKAFYEAWSKVSLRGRLPMLVGGTGLYIDSIVRSYDLVEVTEDPVFRRRVANVPMAELQAELIRLNPRQHNATDLLDRSRLLRALEIARASRSAAARPASCPTLNPVIFGLRWSREELRNRIRHRLQQRLNQGLVEEVETLVAAGIGWQVLDHYGLEYRFVGRFLRGEINRNDLQQQLAAAINNFAKRQDTFFRRMERKGVQINWIDGAAEPAATLLQSPALLGLDRSNGKPVPRSES